MSAFDDLSDVLDRSYAKGAMPKSVLCVPVELSDLVELRYIADTGRAQATREERFAYIKQLRETEHSPSVAKICELVGISLEPYVCEGPSSFHHSTR